MNANPNELTKKLQAEKALMLAQIQELKKDDPFSNPDYSSDNAAVDTDVREQNDHLTIEAEIADLQKRVKDIDLAIAKIEKGRYGICAKCNKEIPQARLNLIPEAQYCVECESHLKR